jgi:hypothetical protein
MHMSTHYRIIPSDPDLPRLTIPARTAAQAANLAAANLYGNSPKNPTLACRQEGDPRSQGGAGQFIPINAETGRAFGRPFRVELSEPHSSPSWPAMIRFGRGQLMTVEGRVVPAHVGFSHVVRTYDPAVMAGRPALLLDHPRPGYQAEQYPQARIIFATHPGSTEDIEVVADSTEAGFAFRLAAIKLGLTVSPTDRRPFTVVGVWHDGEPAVAGVVPGHHDMADSGEGATLQRWCVLVEAHDAVTAEVQALLEVIGEVGDRVGA